MFFKKKNNDPKSGEIRINISRSSSDNIYKNKMQSEIDKRTSICPECGKKNEANPFAIDTCESVMGLCGKVLYSTRLGSCSCGAKWKVDYNY
jgi:hypothetical protein